jgi:arginyl-tRNA--protein-N-Asp/Glu arginylyltransferase
MCFDISGGPWRHPIHSDQLEQSLSLRVTINEFVAIRAQRRGHGRGARIYERCLHLCLPLIVNHSFESELKIDSSSSLANSL